MKVRTDFVSNSSSSSFIVRDDGNTDDMFKSEHLTWKDYTDRFFMRDVLGCYIEACDSWRDPDNPDYSSWHSTDTDEKFSLLKRIKLMSDTEFVQKYLSKQGLPRFVMLERDKDLIPKICSAVELSRLIDADKLPDMWLDGKPDEMARIQWYQLHWKRKQDADDEVEKIITEMKNHMVDVISSITGNWEFWYAEIGDGDGDEGEAYDLIWKYKWYKVFDNH